MKVSEILAKQLKKLRNLSGLSHEELGRKAGLSTQTIYGIEAQKLWVSPKSIEQISSALGVSELELFSVISDEEIKKHAILGELFQLLPGLSLAQLEAVFSAASALSGEVVVRRDKKK